MATNILMPALSPTMTEGTLSKWLVKTGDRVRSGDLIAEIETDKATMEVEAVEDGVIGKILVQENTEGVAVNAPIAILLAEGEDADLRPAGNQDNRVSKPSEATSGGRGSVSGAGAQPSSPPAAHDVRPARVIASPIARRIAQRDGVDLTRITGSGPNGRIVKLDVIRAANDASPSTRSIQAGQGSSQRETPTCVPHSSMRKVIARRLTEAKQSVPHFYVSMDVALDALLSLRSELNAVVPEHDGAAVKISVNDMVIKAAALALRKVPAVNVSFTEKEMLQHNVVDISVAVSLPEGLITPILRDADRLSLRDISIEMKSLVQKAREGKLKPEEFQGGTFSISNMGMYGVRDFGAIINPPQAAILAVAAGEPRAIVREGALSIATVMTVTLSVDHRAIDGSLGAEWLKAFRHIVQNPHLLVV